MTMTVQTLELRPPADKPAVLPDRLTHVVGEQSAVMDFLADPKTHGLTGPDAVVERIDTHGAAVFLAGDKAYKVKRAVCLPYMVFSTLARREEACNAEIEINKPGAPDIYIRTVAITRDAAGKIAINGRGEPIEWAVAMHRFDTDMTFDRLMERRALTDHDLDAAVDAIIAFQNRGSERRAADWVPDLATYIDQNDEAFHEAHRMFPLYETARLTQLAKEELARMRPILLARGENYRVRRCHGDLHLRNLVRIGDGVRLFDAVEFDPSIATGDVLYDLGFLIMDLDESGLRHEANRVLNRFLAKESAATDYEGLAALPLFLSIRAGLRAKISAMSSNYLEGAARARMREDALRFFAYALDALEPRDVSLTVVGGLSGTGKSAIADRLAPAIGRAPGAVVLRSDVVRKTLMRRSWTERLDESAYAPAVTDQVYQTLCALAGRALAAGHSVIIDATCTQPEEREAFEALARSVECHFAGVWLDAPLDVRVARLVNRENDASDADGRVAKLQEAYDIGDLDWPVVDADQPLTSVLHSVRPLVDRLN
ncbi:MAG: AAA family ATPase [Cohaesibacteraceae bacterium]